MVKFLIGAATSPHQVEGNNTTSDCWVVEQLPHSGYTDHSGDACDHYNHYSEDIKLLADAGCNAYRFGVEWARIEPTEGRFDSAAIEHYRRVLKCCDENGIIPIVTLHHFSSPSWLITKGGWGKEAVVTLFARYTRKVAEELGSQIPYICTINEANMGYQLNKIAADMMKTNKKEGSVQVGTSEQMDVKSILLGMLEQGRKFKCSLFAVNNYLKPRTIEQEKIIMAAHCAAVREIKTVCPQTKVGLTLSLFDYQPTDDGQAAAEKLWQEDFGWYVPYIKDDDFLGVQNYSRKIVDASGVREPAPGTPVTQMGYEDYPASIGNVLRRVSKEFKGELIVTENGIATNDDKRRCTFIREAFEAVQNAKKDGVPVNGYLHWSLLDNFEWQAGFGKTFGLIAVDRTTQSRYPKESLSVLGTLAKSYIERGEIQ